MHWPAVPAIVGPCVPRDRRACRVLLLIYYFMFGLDLQAGCPTCSAIADGFDGSIVPLANHDVAFNTTSTTAIDAYGRALRTRRGVGCDKDQ
jgi:predicted dithiol-disulfide oxidoreductase (DUF899 family)